MKNVPRLIDAVCWAYSSALPGKMWAPVRDVGGLTTYCNEGFNFICKRMGYSYFDRSTLERPHGAMLANQMYDVMNDPNGDWMSISDTKVIQYHANSGVLCAAATKNITGHGHVCTIMPGEAELSGSWKMLAPKVMNIGKDVFIGQKASFAFSADNIPRYFALRSML